MSYTYLFAVLTIIALISAVAYKWSFLHTKKIAYISLIQYIYLVVVPGILFSVIFSFIIDVIKKPLNTEIFLSDKLLVVLVLLSTIYTYGGTVIHTIAKTLSRFFTPDQKDSFVYKVNKYFHLKFSHNLSFAGASSSAVFLSLLEINHLPESETGNFILPFFNGLALGFVFIISIVRYHKFDKNKDIAEYFEIKPWSDLKFFFYAFALLFIIFIYGAKPYLKTIKYYPITLSMLVTSFEIILFTFFLYSRRLYRKNKLRSSQKNI